MTDSFYHPIAQSLYLIASILFIVGIRKLNAIKSAKQGNMLSAFGMLIAVVTTFVSMNILSLREVGLAIAIGSIIGATMARLVKMTQMPEMVALFNGFGGAASLLVASAEYWQKELELSIALDPISFVAICLSVIIGGITFTGSISAFMKLSGIGMSGKAIVFKGQHLLNAVIVVLLIILCVSMWTNRDLLSIVTICTIALLLGFLLVIPIGGADMPVVISLLNSYSGVAACTTGFVLNNIVLIVTGALVGASGIILTRIMCKGMNRSLSNVLLGGFGATSSGSSTSSEGNEISIKKIEAEETAMMLDSATSVIVVPGYGLAVSQAQHIIKELMNQLEKRNVPVRFAIHPVAGRMPGHMNVLLAEANVDYDKLFEMERINDDFSSTDIVLVVGANDVVNPAAKTNPSSPIYGMPILNVDKARTVIVSKRSMATGYSGVQNELFGEENCLMLFGDSKVTFTKIVAELKGGDS